MLQGGAHAFEKLSAGDDTLNIPECFAEIIGEGSVVSAADEGIGGCLGVFAAGEKNVGLYLLTPTISALPDIRTSFVELFEMPKCQDIGIMMAEPIFIHGGGSA